MLYLVHGTDHKKTFEQWRKLVASLRAKRPEVLVCEMSDEDFDADKLSLILDSQSLFDPKYLVLLKHLTQNKDGADWLSLNLKNIADAEHVVLCLESTVSKPLLAKFTKYSSKVSHYDLIQTKQKLEFNIFSLADAFGERDRQKLWVTYQTALASGIKPEEIYWRFVGQVKNMLLVARTKNHTDLKMHAFVLQKIKQAAKRFTVPELKKLSTDLVELYFDARNGEREFEVALERLILVV